MEMFLGPDDYALVVIPPGVWTGFKGMSRPFAIVANCCTHPHDPSSHDAPRPVRQPTSRTTGASTITERPPRISDGDGGRPGLGERMHDARVRALPDLPQHHRRRRARDARRDRRGRAARRCTRCRPARRCSTGPSRASGTSATRGSRTPPARGSSTSREQPARRRLQRAGARADAARRAARRTCTRSRSSRTGSRTARRTTTRPGASACAHDDARGLDDGDYEVCIDSTLADGHLTYGEYFLPGRDDRRGADLDARLPSVAGQRQPLGHRRSRPSSRCRSRHCAGGSPTGSCSCPARSARSPGSREQRAARRGSSTALC